MKHLSRAESPEVRRALRAVMRDLLTDQQRLVLRNIEADNAQGKWSTGPEIGRRMGRSQHHASRILQQLFNMGLVRRIEGENIRTAYSYWVNDE